MADRDFERLRLERDQQERFKWRANQRADALREAAEAMFRNEANICVACGLVLDPSLTMLQQHEQGDAEARECLTLPLRRALRNAALPLGLAG